jgi:isoquinoline 1-oxidoreductase alpha subunit
MPPIRFRLNGEERDVDLPADMPLLWALRDHLQLTGTRYSCGEGICGSCMVLIDKEAVQSCITRIADVEGRDVVTIEGLSADSEHPVQRAWNAEQVPQCGYCQSGQILNAVALLQREPRPDEATIIEAMDRVLCRCGTYQRVRRAIERAAEEVRRD